MFNTILEELHEEAINSIKNSVSNINHTEYIASTGIIDLILNMDIKKTLKLIESVLAYKKEAVSQLTKCTSSDTEKYKQLTEVIRYSNRLLIQILGISI